MSNKLDITEYYRLRKLCKTISDFEGVVESERLNDTVVDLGIAALKSLAEGANTLWEFVTLPTVAPLFDKWLENKEKQNEENS